MKELTIRCLVGGLLALIFLWVAYLGGWAFRLTILGFLVFASWELSRLTRGAGWEGSWALNLLGSVGVVLLLSFPWLGLGFLGAWLIYLIYKLFKTRRLTLVPVAAASGLYLGVPAGVALLAREAGFLVGIFPFAVVAAGDTGAYFVGKALGRRHMAPSLSPGKTWEGTLGGLLASSAAGLALGLAMGFGWAGLVGGVCLGAAGVLGDLAESWLKRRAGVKDSSSLLPGHGGVLDRIDGMLGALFIYPLFIYIFATKA